MKRHRVDGQGGRLDGPSPAARVVRRPTLSLGLDACESGGLHNRHPRLEYTESGIGRTYGCVAVHPWRHVYLAGIEVQRQAAVGQQGAALRRQRGIDDALGCINGAMGQDGHRVRACRAHYEQRRRCDGQGRRKGHDADEGHGRRGKNTKKGDG